MIPYSSPSEVCEVDTGKVWPKTITDTKLVHELAESLCAGKGEGWRLPSPAEIMNAWHGLKLDGEHPFDVDGNDHRFWTNEASGIGYVVYHTEADEFQPQEDSERWNVWCVKDCE